MLLPGALKDLEDALKAQLLDKKITFSSDVPISSDFYDEDAKIAGGIRIVSADEEKKRPSRGCCQVKTIIEEKTKKVDGVDKLYRRRRMVIWPQPQNEYAVKTLNFNSDALGLDAISEICSDVLEEAAISGDGDNAYYQLPLPEESRSLYRARTRSGLLVQKPILF